MQTYFEVRTKESRSDYHIVRQIAEKLGYHIDVNGSNSFLLKVIRESLEQKDQMGRYPQLEDVHAPLHDSSDTTKSKQAV